MNVETAIDAITDYCNALDLAEDERWNLAECIIEQMGLNLRQRVSARAAPMAAEEMPGSLQSASSSPLA